MPHRVAVATAALLGMAASAASEPLYRDVSALHLPLQVTGIRSMDVAAFDADADGDADLVVVHEFGPNLLLLNDGRGVFALAAAEALPMTFGDHEDAEAGDLDGDGDIDLVVVCEDDERKELFLNRGDATFERVSDRLPQTGVANGVALGDVDGDGDLDIVVANAGPDELLLNAGDAHFTSAPLPQRPVPDGADPKTVDVSQDVRLGDLDGDGDLDLVFGNEDGNRLLLNAGNGTFIDASTRLPARATPEETRKVALGDVDGDGDLDIYLANVRFFRADPAAPADRQDRVLINAGDASFTDQTGARLPAEDDSNAHAALADLDGDGDLDVLAPAVGSSDPRSMGGLRGPGDRPVRVWTNDGTGRFTQAAPAMLPETAIGNGFDTAVADLDGDGRADIYVANRIGPDMLLLRAAE